MSGWLWLMLGFGYGWMWLHCARKWAIEWLDRERLGNKRHGIYRDSNYLMPGDRAMHFMGALTVALAWPVVLPFKRYVSGVELPSERMEKQEQELEALRRMAREHSLPMPEWKAEK